LCWNNIDDSAASELGDALKVNHTLTTISKPFELDLRYNKIKADGVEDIFEALKVNKSLKSISR
jgi:hypothetical protein